MSYNEAGDRKIHLYIDGKEADYDSQTASQGTRWGDEFIDFRVGDKACIAGSDSFDGKIDEVQVYNQALSSVQIQKLYVEGLEKHKLAEK